MLAVELVGGASPPRARVSEVRAVPLVLVVELVDVFALARAAFGGGAPRGSRHVARGRRAFPHEKERVPAWAPFPPRFRAFATVPWAFGNYERS